MSDYTDVCAENAVLKSVVSRLEQQNAELRRQIDKAETAAHQSAIHPCDFCGTSHSATRRVQDGKVGWLECLQSDDDDPYDFLMGIDC
jgi:hypothetical protein